MSILSILFAAVGLGFLIFIHELGHYWMAKWVGIEVQTFSIGFGKPILKWKRGTVDWQVCWLPFGGYVRVKGMDKSEERDPHEIEGGFFHAHPMKRICFALAGPIVNIAFAFGAFALIWGLGGRDKPFSEFTHRVGWVDPHSALFAEGLRPGDEVTKYDGKEIDTSQDHFYFPLLVGDAADISGYKIDYKRGVKVPFDAEVSVYPHPERAGQGLMTLGVMQPAMYLFATGEMPEGSPMKGSGIEEGDRIFWVDGDLIFSPKQLQVLLDSNRSLLTIERDGQRILRRAPRVKVGDLSLTGDQKAELSDWHYETGVRGRFGEAWMLPYFMDQEGAVVGRAPLIDEEMADEVWPEHLLSPAEGALKLGDRIVAVDGEMVSGPIEVLEALQEREVTVIVKRVAKPPLVSWKEADAAFDRGVDWADLEKMTGSIGSGALVKESGKMVLLKPIVPINALKLASLSGRGEEVLQELADQRQKIAGIENVEVREQALRILEKSEQSLKLGVGLSDRIVAYNPPPTTLFVSVIERVWRTMKALVMGNLHPKWLSGPIGMVQVMHYGLSIGIKEALFWLGAISLNLGVLNLLPIPVLDGGHVCFSLYEWITRRRIKVKTMERLVIPFVVLMIGFFVFVTYHDLFRLFSRWF